MQLHVFTTGGTIDKVYFDAKSQYQIGAAMVRDILVEAGVTLEYAITEVTRKDSLELTDEDRQLLRQAVEASPCSRVLITHGTDTMALTGKWLKGVAGKTVVLTGALAPARFKQTDAPFNVGCAVGATLALPPGVYVAMNGRIFEADKVRKNSETGCFEEVAG